MTPYRCRRLASTIDSARERRARRDRDLLHRQLEIVGAGRQLHEVDDRRPQRGLRDLHRADLVRRDDAVGAGPLQLDRRVVGFGAADDEQIGPQHARAQHGVDVLGVGADRGDQPARALDADALQHVFAAGVGLHRQRAVVDRRLQPLGDRARRRRTAPAAAGTARRRCCRCGRSRR